jgi:(heptosyl)LPS beta-1,4-glucosyltransferase
MGLPLEIGLYHKTSHRRRKIPTISAYIITKNEVGNIARAIESVRWMDEVIVLDSGSDDGTAGIAERLGARVIVEPFRGFFEQKNRAMELCTGEWVFSLDADEEVTPELSESIRSVLRFSENECVPDVFTVARKTWYMGKWILHCGWYPERRERLAKRNTARWTGDKFPDHLAGTGKVGHLRGDLLHRPYADLGDHLRRIELYSRLWAAREASKGRSSSPLDLAARPVARFLKMYILKAGFLDGRQGFVASSMGAWYAFLKYARLMECAGDRP